MPEDTKKDMKDNCVFIKQELSDRYIDDKGYYESKEFEVEVKGFGELNKERQEKIIESINKNLEVSYNMNPYDANGGDLDDYIEESGLSEEDVKDMAQRLVEFNLIEQLGIHNYYRRVIMETPEYKEIKEADSEGRYFDEDGSSNPNTDYAYTELNRRKNAIVFNMVHLNLDVGKDTKWEDVVDDKGEPVLDDKGKPKQERVELPVNRTMYIEVEGFSQLTHKQKAEIYKSLKKFNEDYKKPNKWFPTEKECYDMMQRYADEAKKLVEAEMQKILDYKEKLNNLSEMFDNKDILNIQGQENFFEEIKELNDDKLVVGTVNFTQMQKELFNRGKRFNTENVDISDDDELEKKTKKDFIELLNLYGGEKNAEKDFVKDMSTVYTSIAILELLQKKNEEFLSIPKESLTETQKEYIREKKQAYKEKYGHVSDDHGRDFNDPNLVIVPVETLTPEQKASYIKQQVESVGIGIAQRIKDMRTINIEYAGNHWTGDDPVLPVHSIEVKGFENLDEATQNKVKEEIRKYINSDKNDVVYKEFESLDKSTQDELKKEISEKDKVKKEIAFWKKKMGDVNYDDICKEVVLRHYNLEYFYNAIKKDKVDEVNKFARGLVIEQLNKQKMDKLNAAKQEEPIVESKPVTFSANAPVANNDKEVVRVQSSEPIKPKLDAKVPRYMQGTASSDAKKQTKPKASKS